MTAAQLRGPAQSAPARDQTLQRGLELLRQRRLDETEFSLTAALAKNPTDFEALHFLAMLRQQQDRQLEALDLIHLALRHGGRSAELLALQNLLRSQIDGHDEALVGEAIDAPVRTRIHPPHWNGEYVAGTLLVSGCQQLGEQILFASMVPDLTSCADHVILEVEPRLIDLFARSFPHMRVVPIGSGIYAAEANAQVAMTGLARQLRPNCDAFPRRTQGFLSPDRARATALRDRLASDGRVVVGLSWKSKSSKFAKAKSARLLDFTSVLRLPNCRFVDVQYGDTRAEREAVANELGVHVERFGNVDNNDDIDGLATLIAACDIVVSVSNTTAHLAGALGRPTWEYAPHGQARPWYWFDEGSDSPWYPYLHVKRQASGRSWADLIASTAAEIW
jgi:hypothetical protein